MSISQPRVALFQPYPHTLGGLQAVVLQLCRDLPDHGWQPLIICPEEGKFTEAARKAHARVLVSDPGETWHAYGRGDRTLSYLFSPKRVWQLLRYWVRLSRELRREKISVLHCNDYRAVMLAAPAARLAGIPVVWHMHGFIRSALVNVACAMLSTRVAAVSRGMLDYFKLPGFLKSKFSVIYNGLDVPASAEVQPAQAQTVVAVGTLHPRKGYETLIRAFRDVKASCPQAECHIFGGEFGDGSYARELRELAQRLGVADRIFFRGYSSEVAAEMAHSWLLAIPSRIEAFGMVAIEAMAAGKPVVATRTGGLKDIVLDGETGFLVEEDDAAEMGQRIIHLLQEPARATAMGLAGRERVRREFALSQMNESFSHLYDSLTQPTPRSQALESAAMEAAR